MADSALYRLRLIEERATAMRELAADYPTAMHVEDDVFQVEHIGEPTCILSHRHRVFVARRYGHAWVRERAYMPPRPRVLLDRLIDRRPEMLAECIEIVRGK